MTTKTFRWDIGERVYCPALESYCRVSSLWHSERGNKYEICYFHDGERRECYVFETELADQK